MKRIENVKDREGIKFVAKAVSKEETRFNLQAMYFDKGWGLMLASDGHRLHAYQPEEELEEGFYTVLVNKKKELIIAKEPENQDREFPDWVPIFPHVKGSGLHLYADKRRDVFNAYTQAVRSMGDYEYTFNYAYIEQVLTSDESGWEFWQTYTDGPALFVNHTKFALVMPCRM